MKRFRQTMCLWACLLTAQTAHAEQALARVRSWINWMPRQVLQQVNHYLNGRLEVASTHFTFPSSLTLRDIRLKDAQGGLIASADSIQMQLALSALLKGRLVMNKMVIAKPMLYLNHAEGKLNWKSLFRTQDAFGKKRNIFLRIDDIIIQNGRFFFENLKQKVEIVCETVHAEGSLEMNGKQVSIKASSLHSHRGTINAKHLQFPYQNLQADSLSFQDKILHINQATSLIMGLHARGQGGIDFNTKSYNIKGLLDAPRATWPIGLAPLSFPLPSFQARGSLTGKLKEPIVQARAEFSECKPYNITVQQGWLTAHITRHQVRIEDGLLQLEGGGSIKPQGWVRYADRSLLFQSHLENIRVANVVRAGQSNISLDGFMTGSLRVTGIANGKKPINFVFQGEGKQLQILGRSTLEQAQMHLNLDLRHKGHLQIHQASLQAPGVQSVVVGTVRQKGSSLLKISGTAKNARLLLPDLPDFLAGEYLKFNFNVKNIKKLFKISRGRVRFGKLKLWNQTIKNTRLNFSQAKYSQAMQIKVRTGELAAGQITGNLHIHHMTSTGPITGDFTMRRLSLSKFQQTLPAWAKPTGVLNAQLTLSGSLSHPQASFHLQGQDITMHQLPLGTLSGHGQITPGALHLSQLTTNHQAITTTLQNFHMPWSTKRLTGHADVHVMSLGSFVSSLQPQWEGHLQSKIEFGGTWASPQLQSNTKVENLHWKQIPLGAGFISVWLKDHTTQSRGTRQALLQISGKLKRGNQNISLRSSILPADNKLRLHIGADGVSVTPWSKLLPYLVPMSGHLQLNLSAWGNWNSPKVVANMNIAHLKTKRKEDFSTYEIPTWHPVGSLHSHFSLTSGQLQGSVCTSRENMHVASKSCSTTDPLQMHFHGTVRPSGALNIKTVGRLTDVPLGQFLQHLQEQSIETTTSLDFNLTIKRSSRASALTTNGHLDIQKLQTTGTGFANIQLQKPVKLRLANNRLQSTSPIGFAWDDQEIWLQGWVEPKQLDAQVQGVLPLQLIAAYLPQEISASGNLTGKLRVWGPWESPLWQGSLLTDSQIMARVRGIHDTVRWHEGQLLLAPSSNHPGCTNITAQRISLDIGGGHLKINGETNICPGQKRTQGWNAHLQLENIIAKWERSWLELSGELLMTTQKGSNQLTGDVNVSTGLLTRRFSWQDFVLTATTSQNGWQQSSLNWLAPLNMNVHILTPSLPFWVDIAVARIRGSIASDLRLKTGGKEFFLEGGAEILEGTVQFPAIDFTMQQDTILLKRRPGSFANAHIDIKANSTELPQEQSALNTPVSLQLSLLGNWNRMRATLQSFPQDSKLDPSSMLAMLVSPAGTSSIGALLALSSQVALQPAVGEFEEWFFDSTQSRLRVSSTTQVSGSGPRVQWEMDERIELEAAASFGASASSINNLRLRVLLFDHLPVGHSFFLEGAALVPYERGSDIRLDQRLRLVYRILER